MRNHIDKAHEIAHGTTKQFLQFRQELERKLTAVKMDVTLSEKGKSMQQDAIRREYRQKLVTLVKEIRASYDTEVAKAKKAAEAVVLSRPEKPSPEILERYQNELKDLHIRLALTPDGRYAADMLEDYLSSIADRSKADFVRSAFGELIQTVLPKLGGQDLANTQITFRKAYDGLQTNFLSDQEREAVSTLESVKVLEGRPLFVSVVHQAATALLGRHASQILTDPDSFKEDDRV